MRVLLFGATGMIGQGVLRECLLASDVDSVLAVGRAQTGRAHPKLAELVHADLLDLTAVEDRLAGHDACFFCLGVSSAGMKEADYRRVTYDFTLSVAGTLARRNPGTTFVYVSGMGTDSTAEGRVMWARVKGETENALLALPLRAYMMRPGFIQPMHGARSRTRLYAALYAVTRPLFPLVRRLAPNATTTTEQVGRAMLALARRGGDDAGGKRILDSRDIVAAAG